ncbi:sperm-associated antigen 16 protein-like [Salarias fasciatus]|uniref:Sperm-associated antigen 16 protein-like n=1 Tax=Salarias fasciatus TaxID=181472 RepID=A0A672G4E7_SALFA|nr:sperm-associated antigen 16 protein-like [Salarias fasciatus]
MTGSLVAMATASVLPHGAMTAKKKTHEKSIDDLSIDSDGDFKYEEDHLEGECSLTEGEEDPEAEVKADIQVRTNAPAPTRVNTENTRKPTTVLTFIRNYLSQMGMEKTLDCFQTEWTEVTEKGLVDPEQVSPVPDVYIENQHLENQLMNARREREEYRQAAAASAETLLRAQKLRDVHRLQHKRVVQEKNRLIEELRRLQLQCSNNTPAVLRMKEKCQVALKQVMQVASERDKALGQMDSQSPQGVGAEEPSIKQSAASLIQPRPPTGPGRQSKGRSVKPTTP